MKFNLLLMSFLSSINWVVEIKFLLSNEKKKDTGSIYMTKLENIKNNYSAIRRIRKIRIVWHPVYL